MARWPSQLFEFSCTCWSGGGGETRRSLHPFVGLWVRASLSRCQPRLPTREARRDRLHGLVETTLANSHAAVSPRNVTLTWQSGCSVGGVICESCKVENCQSWGNVKNRLMPGIRSISGYPIWFIQKLLQCGLKVKKYVVTELTFTFFFRTWWCETHENSFP